MEFKGYIYVLSNPSLPGKVKIGRTYYSIDRRIEQLSNTSIPTPFEAEAYYYSSNPAQDEKEAHHLLRRYRVRADREFFTITPAEAILKLTEWFGRAPLFVKADVAEAVELERVRVEGVKAFDALVASELEYQEAQRIEQERVKREEEQQRARDRVVGLAQEEVRARERIEMEQEEYGYEVSKKQVKRMMRGLVVTGFVLLGVALMIGLVLW